MHNNKRLDMGGKWVATVNKFKLAPGAVMCVTAEHAHYVDVLIENGSNYTIPQFQENQSRTGSNATVKHSNITTSFLAMEWIYLSNVMLYGRFITFVLVPVITFHFQLFSSFFAVFLFLLFYFQGFRFFLLLFQYSLLSQVENGT